MKDNWLRPTRRVGLMFTTGRGEILLSAPWLSDSVPSKRVRMCGHSKLQMSPNHLRTSGRPDNISWDSWVTRHCHLCRRSQMAIPRSNLSTLDSNDCIIMVPRTPGFLAVGENNSESHTFESMEKIHTFPHISMQRTSKNRQTDRQTVPASGWSTSEVLSVFQRTSADDVNLWCLYFEIWRHFCRCSH